MKLIKIIKISAFCMVLIFFYCLPRHANALPLTDTVFSLQDDNIEFLFKEEIHNLQKDYRVDQTGLGFGILDDLSFWFIFQYLHSGIIKTDEDVIGDTFLRLLYYIGDYYNDSIHLALLIKFRFPTGKNIYYNQEWRGLSLGNSEIKIGFVSQFDIIKRIFVHFNFSYTFLQGINDNFYGGFYLNPIKESFYTKVLGLNPFSKGSFLYWERLKNDYITLSLAVNTNVLYPFIPHIELYGVFRFVNREDELDYVSFIPCEADPLLLSAGLRYFFSKYTYLGFYYIINPIKVKDYIRDLYGVDFGILF
ncbi:hypothetical protein ACFL20_00795 [Spirochaetota bacterium]